MIDIGAPHERHTRMLDQVGRTLERQLTAHALRTARVPGLHALEPRLHFLPEVASDDPQLGTLGCERGNQSS